MVAPVPEQGRLHPQYGSEAPSGEPGTETWMTRMLGTENIEIKRVNNLHKEKSKLGNKDPCWSTMAQSMHKHKEKA